MSSTNSTKGLPNPDVYLNHIPPVTAAQFEVSRNIYLATLGAFMWDMLSSLPEDIYLMRHFNSNTIPYFLSRISALSYVLLSVIAKTTPGPDCVKLEFGITSCWVIAISSSSFLFLRRVMAVFADSRSIRFVFSFLWVANVGISVVTPVGSRASPLEDTGYCINGGIKHYVGAATIMPLVFDSLKTLPRLSRAMFRGGQQYYLVTVGVNILITVLITTPSVPPIYQATFTIPDIALTSSMACRVYRNLYFKAKYSGTTFNDTEMNVRFATRLRPSTITTGGMTSTDTPSAVTGDSRKMSSIHVDIEQGTSSNDNVSLPDKVLKPDPVH
uniref:Integral membrane protein n=1 Tax=Moniliophthora roreri TaxID=221103 RepID=A0A0W0EWB0_MONRR